MRWADFGPTPGRRPELVDEVLDRAGVDRGHPAPPSRPAEAAQVDAAHGAWLQRPATWATASWRAASTRSSSISTSSGSTAVGVDGDRPELHAAGDLDLDHAAAGLALDHGSAAASAWASSICCCIWPGPARAGRRGRGRRPVGRPRRLVVASARGRHRGPPRSARPRRRPRSPGRGRSTPRRRPPGPRRVRCRPARRPSASRLGGRPSATAGGVVGRRAAGGRRRRRPSTTSRSGHRPAEVRRPGPPRPRPAAARSASTVGGVGQGEGGRRRRRRRRSDPAAKQHLDLGPQAGEDAVAPGQRELVPARAGRRPRLDGGRSARRGSGSGSAPGRAARRRGAGSGRRRARASGSGRRAAAIGGGAGSARAARAPRPAPACGASARRLRASAARRAAGAPAASAAGAGGGRRLAARAVPRPARSRRSMRSSRASARRRSPGRRDADQRHLERDAGVGRLAHVDQGLAQHLEGPGDGGGPQALGLVGRRGPVARRSGATRSTAHGGEEGVAQAVEQLLADAAGVAARRPSASATATRARPVSRSQRASTQLVDRRRRRRATPPAATIWSSAERVSRADPPPSRTAWSMPASSTSRPASLDDPADVVLQLVGRQQAELEVLGAAADGGQHLLRVGGGQHEHDVVRRLLQRLQQGVRRPRREHVDLVEDVDLVRARACRARRRR